MLTPALRLKIDARLAAGAPLYVLALERLSVVAALRELCWQVAVRYSERFLEEQEYAATVIETLCPMAHSARLLPPGSDWIPHATLRLHTDVVAIDGEESEDVLQMAFSLNQLELPEEALSWLQPQERANVVNAYEEEYGILRALDGFEGDGATLLETLRIHMEHGAALAKAQLFSNTAHRAGMGLWCLYAVNRTLRKRIATVADWLEALKYNEEHRLEEHLRSSRASIVGSWRKH